jgi:ADP-dependent NAD(P)H-hydrate dehydratase / NAD(P)H-hydrate epimerase
MIPASVPILSCEEAGALEKKIFGGDEGQEWAAMQRAGHAVAEAVLTDFEEIGAFAATSRILVLAGKGHNGGDALIATRAILERFQGARADVIFVFGQRALRPLAARAWQELAHAAGDRVRIQRARPGGEGAYALCLDGVFGFQFRPPVDAAVTALIEAVNAAPIRLRAAVDLPSGGLFKSDFTYATGSVKSPVFEAAEAGRIRFLDLGFFGGNAAGGHRVLTAGLLAPLAGLRAVRTDKRTFGHVLVLGGSRSYPGAILMTVLAALRSGAGLVTAFVPESLAPAFAARAPEAMWVGWPETPAGGLALEGEHLLRERLGRADALVIGPGMGREAETLALAASVAGCGLPAVIDADALQPEVVRAGKAARIVTPHAGEFARIKQNEEVPAHTVVVLKGPITRIWESDRAGGPTYHSCCGGPVLARGGSGDLLAGLIGGLLAQAPAEPLIAAARGVVWHGLAADLLARQHGQVAVSVTQLLDFLPAALRISCNEPAGSSAP